MGTLTSWNPLGLCRPVTGLIYISPRLTLLKIRYISDEISRQTQNNSMYSNFFFFRKSCLLRDNVEKFCTTGQATDNNTAHAHCVLYTSGCKHTLRILNTYCLSTSTMVTRRTPNVTSTRTLPLWLIIAPQ